MHLYLASLSHWIIRNRTRKIQFLNKSQKWFYGVLLRLYSTAEKNLFNKEYFLSALILTAKKSKFLFICATNYLNDKDSSLFGTNIYWNPIRHVLPTSEIAVSSIKDNEKWYFAYNFETWIKFLHLIKIVWLILWKKEKEKEKRGLWG